MDKYKNSIKILISFVMIALIYRATDFNKLSQTFSSISVESVLIVLLVYFLGQVISAYKWWNILKASGIKVSFSKTIKSYFIGMFVNCFGLGTVGGDVARALLVAGRENSKVTSLSSVIADRAHGLAILALIGSISAFTFGSDFLDKKYSYIMLAVAICAILGWFTGPFIARKFLPSESKLREKIENVTKAFPTDPKTILFISALSLLFHSIQLLLHYWMGYIVFVDLPLKELFIIIPIINILATLPISWNGLGVREQAYAFFLAPHLLSTEQAVTFGALWLLAVTTCSAIGGLVSWLNGSNEKDSSI
jgi:uncharacterized membrane protein YbhN (UPF0104 family)